MKPLLKGILMGPTITVSFGPKFMTLFQISIECGVKAMIVLALGMHTYGLFIFFLGLISSDFSSDLMK
jgi:hypothetical protein